MVELPAALDADIAVRLTIGKVEPGVQHLGLKRVANAPALVALDEGLVDEREGVLGGEPALGVVRFMGREGVRGATGSGIVVHSYVLLSRCRGRRRRVRSS